MFSPLTSNVLSSLEQSAGLAVPSGAAFLFRCEHLFSWFAFSFFCPNKSLQMVANMNFNFVGGCNE